MKKIVFNGKEYSSIKEACYENNVPYETLIQRSKRTGESYTDVLDYFLNNNIIINGKQFKSLYAACKNYDVNMSSVTQKMEYERISAEEAINLLRKKGRRLYNTKNRIKIKGIEFPSYRAACDFYKKDYGTVITNKNNKNIKFEEALFNSFSRKVKVTILGKEYNTIKEACYENDISTVTVYNYMKNDNLDVVSALELAISHKKQPTRKITKKSKISDIEDTATIVKKAYFAKAKNKYKSYLRYKKEDYYLGLYLTKEEALTKCDEAEKNFIESGLEFKNWYKEFKKKRNEDKIIGASYYAELGRWRSQIVINKKKYHLGYFETAEDAKKVYLEAKKVPKDKFKEWHKTFVSENEKNRENDVIGASFSASSGKWFARIKVKRKEYYLGSYDTKEEAIYAYKEAKKISKSESDFLEWYKTTRQNKKISD